MSYIIENNFEINYSLNTSNLTNIFSEDKMRIESLDTVNSTRLQGFDRMIPDTNLLTEDIERLHGANGCKYSLDNSLNQNYNKTLNNFHEHDKSFSKFNEEKNESNELLITVDPPGAWIPEDSNLQKTPSRNIHLIESSALSSLQAFLDSSQFTEKNNSIDFDNKSYDFFLKKKKLIEIVKNLSNIEYQEIFNIFKEDNCQYTENANGVFINLQNIQENTLDKIFNFIDYIQQKKIELNEHDEFINNAKKNISIIKKEVNNLIITDKDKYVNYNYYDSDNDDTIKNNNELLFSSDEDEDIESKLSLKKKKNKYVGKKAKIIKSIKNDQDNKLKIKK